ncbi:MAG: DUF948 domain-containing protein [Candidatus Methylomirabilales bacterium]
MKLGELAAVIASLGFVALVAFLSTTLLRVQGLLSSTQALVQDLQRNGMPILEELRETVATLNVELDRVDSIMAAAESVSSSVANVTQLVTSATRNPIIKGLSFLAGMRAGVSSLRRRKKVR